MTTVPNPTHGPESDMQTRALHDDPFLQARRFHHDTAPTATPTVPKLTGNGAGVSLGRLYATEAGADVHELFATSPADYLVLHRSLLQSMPAHWQRRLVQLLDDYALAFSHVSTISSFTVQPLQEMRVHQLTAEQRAQQGIACNLDDLDGLDDAAMLAAAEDPQFVDQDGNELEAAHVVAVPALDPVPHHDGGATFVPPAVLRVPAPEGVLESKGGRR